MIMFLDNYFSYYNIAFLYRKFEDVEAIKSIFQMWLNTTWHSVKRLHTENRKKYIMSELKFFSRKQEVIHETSILHVY